MKILLHYRICDWNVPITISAPEKRGHGAPGDPLALRRAQFRPGDGERAAHPQVLPKQNRVPSGIFENFPCHLNKISSFWFPPFCLIVKAFPVHLQRHYRNGLRLCNEPLLGSLVPPHCAGQEGLPNKIPIGQEDIHSSLQC